MARASVYGLPALALIIALAPATALGQVEVSEPWTTMMLRKATSISDRTPVITNESVEEMAQAYAFDLGHRMTLDVLAELHPHLAREFHGQLAEYNKRFSSSVRMIDESLLRFNKPWKDTRTELESALRSAIDRSALRDKATARSFLEEAMRRGRGEIPERIKQALSTCNPTYLAQPGEEMIRGNKLRHRIPKGPKNPNLAISLEFPISWQIREGNHPHTVATGTSESGRGLEAFTVQIRAQPEDFDTSNSSHDDLLALADAVAPDSASTTHRSITSIGGAPCVIVELDSTNERLGLVMHAKNVHFVVLRNGHVIHMSAAVAAEEHELTRLEDRLNAYRPLFGLIANSLVCPDREAR